jgi:hypothetical protein
VLAAGWLAALAFCAGLSANPVTVNRAQVLDAFQRGWLVEGHVLDVAAGRVRLQRSLADTSRSLASPLPEEFVLANLSAAGARAGEAYLLPIVPALDGRLEIVAPSRGGDDRPLPLIYPAGPEAEQQLLGILSRSPTSSPKTGGPAARGQ